LGLGFDPDGFVILYDHRSGLDYLRQIRDLREHGLELRLDGYGTHVFLRFEEVSDGDDVGWAELAQRQGLAGMPDARVALRRMRDEPVREAVRAIFSTRVAQEAFLPDPGEDETTVGADAARSALAASFDRLVSVVDADADTVSIAYDTSRLAAHIRAVRPRLLAQSLAGWALFEAVGTIACDGDHGRTTEAYDDWDGAVFVGDLARRSGSGDALAWRAAELARALLALEPGALLQAADADGLPGAWFEIPAVRAATGWNQWEGETFISAEAWDEFVDALAEREVLLESADASDHAAQLRRRAAEADYKLDVTDDAAAR
jgi:hypothetical protein